MEKTALIWGASGGIGKAIAHKLDADGWQVLAVGRNIYRMEVRNDHVFEADTLWKTSLLQPAHFSEHSGIEELQSRRTACSPEKRRAIFGW